MNLIMVMCAGEHLADVQRIIDSHEVSGYTEIPNVPGSGATGRRMGTRAYPGTSSIVLTAVPNEVVGTLIEDLRAFAARLRPGEGVRAFVLPVDQMI